jgi:hypothetical protein
MSTKTYATALAVVIALAATSAKAVEIQNADHKPYTLKITENGATRDYVLGAGKDESAFCTGECTIEVVGLGTIKPIDADSAEKKYLILDGVLSDATNEHDEQRGAYGQGGHGHHYGGHAG